MSVKKIDSQTVETTPKKYTEDKAELEKKLANYERILAERIAIANQTYLPLINRIKETLKVFKKGEIE